MTAAATHAPLTLARQPDPDPDLGIELARLLDDLTAANERLVLAVEAHREAMRKADAKAMASALSSQRDALEAVAHLDERRRRLVDAASLAMAWEGPGPITLTALARRQPEPARTTLLASASRLKDLVKRARDGQRASWSASTALASHVEGLIRAVAKHLSHAGTYGRKGFTPAGPVLAGGLDVRS
ncbi:MAG: flagellar protein FlgN [Phycisphaeraceae bacterium]|nr:MAG: flagellar protein FlgN [Phycisphaeraceae bacterium]